jgi:hypothetical protein
MIIAHICPLHSSNSRSQTFPRHLQSEALITSFLENSHKRMVHFPLFSVSLYFIQIEKGSAFFIYPYVI